MNLSNINLRQIRVFIVSLIAFLTLALAWAVYSAANYLQIASTGQVNLTIVPQDATVLIDNSTTAASDTLMLKPGTHTLTFSRDGFASKSVSVTIQAKEQLSQTVILLADSDTGTRYLESHPDQQQMGEGITGAQANKVGQQITQDNPLIKLLPYQGSDFRVDAGISKKYPNDPTAVAVYITTTDSAGQQHALDWIRAQGYDPSTYEIIYESTSNGQ